MLCGTQGKIDVVVGHSHQHTSVCSSSYGCLPTHPRGSKERPTGNEFARENKLHQVSNASINTIFQCPISAQAVPVFGPGGGNSNVQISNALERRGWRMLKFRVNRRITANSK